MTLEKLYRPPALPKDPTALPKDSPNPAKDSPNPAKDSPNPAKDSPNPANAAIDLSRDSDRPNVQGREPLPRSVSRKERAHVLFACPSPPISTAQLPPDVLEQADVARR